MDPVRLFGQIRQYWTVVHQGLSPFLPYIITVVAVGLVPLALAGIGGHLAAVALPENQRSRRRWKLGVWSLAIFGIALFGYSQYLAYLSDQGRDAKQQAFQNKVLEKLNGIVDEPSRKKRKEAAKDLVATLHVPVTSASRSIPPSTNATKQSPPAITPELTPSQPHSPPISSVIGDAPDEDAPIACPAPGKLSRGWNIDVEAGKMQAAPLVFRYIGPDPTTKDINTLHPFLRAMKGDQQWHTLDIEHLKEASDLFAELQASLPKRTANDSTLGPVVIKPISIGISRHYLHNPDQINLSYANETKAGIILGYGKEVSISISSLSESGRHAIADFDALANAQADSSCALALRQLRAGPTP